MFKQLEGARLGIFIFIGTVLLVISIFMLGSKEKLFTRTIEIKTYFNQIEGLKPGAPVRLSGYDIGSVSSIALVDKESGNVEVKMRIDNRLNHFIRLDSKAVVETEGLVGKKIISISPGSSNLAIIEDGGIMQSKDPVNIAAIVEESEEVISYLRDLTRNLSEIISKVNQGEGTMGKIVNDDQLYTAAVRITNNANKSLTVLTERLSEITDIIVSTSGSIESIVANVDTAIFDARNLLYRVENGEGALGLMLTDKSVADSIQIIINNLVKTSDDTRLATSRLAENMEALKYNWLFKSYFEQRGYMDKAEYEKEIDAKLFEIKKQNDILDRKIRELLDLEKRTNR